VGEVAAKGRSLPINPSCSKKAKIIKRFLGRELISLPITKEFLLDLFSMG
jgi:hypothetical protein